MSDERRRRGNVLVTPAVQMTAAASGSSGISVPDSAEYDLAASDFALPVRFAYQEGGENLLAYSQEFDNAAWTKSNTTISANVFVAPDGTTTADKLVEDGTLNLHRLFFGTAASAATYTASIYAKYSGRDYFAIRLFSSAAGDYATAVFNVSTGAVGATASSAGYTGLESSMSPVGNGWYRCVVKATSANTIDNYLLGLLESNIANTDGGTTYTGDGTSGIYIWGAQLETGSVATTYTKTEATANLNWMYYKFQDANNYWGLRLRSDKIMQFLAVTAGVTRLSITSTTLTATQGHIIEGVFTCVRESASAAGSGSFYVNGSQLGASVAIAAATAPSIRNTGILYIMGSNAVRNLSQAVRAIIANFAPTAAQVSALYSSGIPDAWKWGSNVPFESSDFSAGVNGYGNQPGSSNTFTGNVDAISGVNDTLRITGSGTFFNTFKTDIVAGYLGADILVTFDYFADAACGVAFLGWGGNTQRSNTGNNLAVVEGSWQSVKMLVTPNASFDAVQSRAICGYNDLTGSNGDPLDTGKNIYLKNISIKKLGATLALLPETLPTSGALAWPDSSTNANDAALPAAGATKVTIRA